jgi:hypothetical protein
VAATPRGGCSSSSWFLQQLPLLAGVSLLLGAQKHGAAHSVLQQSQQRVCLIGACGELCSAAAAWCGGSSSQLLGIGRA